VVAAANIVDALKLMSYDYYGGWSNTIGHLANVFKNPIDREGWSTDQAVSEYLKAGVPPQKIQMGFAFYGRAFQSVSPGPNNDGLYQRYESVPFGEGEVTWTQIVEFLEPDSGFKRYWDDAAKSPYLYDGDIWITYCDEQLIAELANYVKNKNLGGFFVWEYTADMNANLLKVLSDNAQKK
jgi:chitinase